MIPNSCLINVNAWTAYFLSSEVDCGSPDDRTSIGATFLCDTRDATVEHIRDGIDDDDLLNVSEHIVENFGSGHYPLEVATVDVWRTFTDLAAWQEDLRDVGIEAIKPDELSEAAETALGLIGDRVRDAVARSVEIEFRDRVEAAGDLLTTLGDENGQSAAHFWLQDHIGGRSTGDTSAVARRLLDGIENGDPVTMDALPSADLSGQWADGTTVSDLLQHVDLDGLDVSSAIAGELADTYTYAFDTAVQTAVQEACSAVLDVEGDTDD